ncbi:MAG: PAS domain S-box protein, partial [Holophaga sp.]
RKASFQGWEYAMEHPEEIIQHILTLPGVATRSTTPEKLRFEAARMKELILPGLVDAGHMNPGRFRRIAQIAMKQGFVKTIRDPEGFLFEPPVPAAKTLLRALTLGGPVVLGILLMVGLWIMQLRRTVHSRTRALREEVAQRQQREEALRESKAQYDNLVERIPVGVYLIRSKPDHSFGFDFASPKMADLFGVELDALRKDVQLGFKAVHPDDLDHFVKLNQDGLKFLVPFFWEGRVVVEGDVKWLHIASTPEPLADGDVLWHGVVVDITERKRSEEALRESEGRFRGLLQCVDSVAVQGYAPDGTIQYWNQASERLYGFTAQEAVGRNLLDLLIPPEMQEGVAEAMRTMWATGQAIPSSELSLLRKDGSRIQVYSSHAIVHIPGREPELFCIDVDLTERKRLEAQLQQTQKMQSLGSLAGGVAHDINNVLAAILGLASANLEIQPQGSPTYRAFETISKAAIRGGKTVKSLLSFARQSPAEDRVVDMNAILRDEVQLLERTTLSVVRLELDLQSDLHAMRGDVSALTHALMNLCVNAVDAMVEGGTLTLRTRNLDSAWIEIQVQDNGLGMPREVLNRALDPFFTTKDVGKGTGLGLSMVYSTVMAHHGDIEIQSDPGQGTCVSLRFPAILPADLPQAMDHEAAQEGARTKLRVLLVDDDELIRSSIGAVLAALGHEASTVPSGEEALERLQMGLEADVMILDMNMPGLGGAGTLAKLRTLRPSLPVLLATGRADQSAWDLAETYPKVSLLPKPFSMVELNNRLQLLNRN